MSLVFPRNGVSRIFGLHLFPTYLESDPTKFGEVEKVFEGRPYDGVFFFGMG